MFSLTSKKKNILAAVLVTTSLTGFGEKAHAIPAFARQTGMECSACHVGSFGPQLTNYGRQFKLNGYVWGDAKNPTKGLSAMVYGGFEHTNSDMRKGTELSSDAHSRYGTNDNFTVDQASLFYGGRLLDNVGIFSQMTYSDPDRTFSWDNLDMRYANNTTVGGKSLVYGVTVNNNPSVQDIWNTAPAWRFPYLSSGLAPTPDASPYINSLAQTVGGVGVYGMWNDLVYAELSGYTTLPHDTQLTLGIKGSDEADHLHNFAPYWRVGLQQNFGNSYAAIGTYGMAAEVYPGNIHDFGTDKHLDYAVDATYQYTSGSGKHTFSLYGSALREEQNLDSTFAAAGSANSHDSLVELTANASYYYNNTYGITLSRFDITGSADPLLYSGSSTGKPDSSGWVAQLDLTPFGTENSPGWPYFNNRFFIQYTAYDKFNGASKNYDGTGRNASDNNTIFVGDWIAF